jgi:hypothetical protein
LWAHLNLMMHRSGNYLAELEGQIVSVLKRSPPPLLWERYIRLSDPRVAPIRFLETTIAVIVSPGVIAAAFGVALPWGESGRVIASVAVAETVVLGTAIAYSWTRPIKVWKTSLKQAHALRLRRD